MRKLKTILCYNPRKTFFLFCCCLFCNFSFGQNSEAGSKEKYFLKEINANFSFVNLGIINHWSMPLNIDDKHPYMHFTLGVQSTLTKNISLRLDYFSNYGNFISKNIFNPSVITVSPRFTFNKNNSINPFINLKGGIAIVEPYDSFTYNLEFKPLPVMGIKTGVIARIGEKISLGFSFDNSIIWYKFRSKFYQSSPNFNNSYTGNNSYVGYVGYDASHISILTTDIIYHFLKKS